MLHTALPAQPERADTLFIAGEAGSRCVRATTEYIVDQCWQPETTRIAP